MTLQGPVSLVEQPDLAQFSAHLISRRSVRAPVYYQPVISGVIPDRATAYGERVRRRLTGEMTIWLTTVGRDGTRSRTRSGSSGTAATAC